MRLTTVLKIGVSAALLAGSAATLIKSIGDSIVEDLTDIPEEDLEIITCCDCDAGNDSEEKEPSEE